MEAIASTSHVENPSKYGTENHLSLSTTPESKKEPGGMFRCTFCTLEERYDFKGAKPPFAKQIVYSESCYILKDPFSLPNRGEVLVLGADCSICNKSVCLGCSIFYAKRFCQKCAMENMSHLPPQLHTKIKTLTSKDTPT